MDAERWWPPFVEAVTLVWIVMFIVDVSAGVDALAVSESLAETNRTVLQWLLVVFVLDLVLLYRLVRPESEGVPALELVPRSHGNPLVPAAPGRTVDPRAQAPEWLTPGRLVAQQDSWRVPEFMASAPRVTGSQRASAHRRTATLAPARSSQHRGP